MNLKRNYYSIYFLVSLFLCSCGMTNINLQETSSILEIENQLQKAIEKKVPPGISIIVVKKDKVVYSKGMGYADLPKQIKATPQTIYQWWSITKPFTATAILQLHENNLLDLNDPVSKHLSFFNVQAKHSTDREITIKDLLNHSAGLKDIGNKIIGWIHYDDDQPYDQTNLVKTQLPNYQKLNTSPGQEGQYSNLGYMLLAAVIEKVTTQSYSSYIVKNILEPLEMNTTDFHYSKMDSQHIAVGSHPKDAMSLLAFTMIDREKAIREKKDGVFYFNNIYSNQQGSTGLLGSTQDLSHFLIAMLNQGKWKDQQILSPESIKMMFSPQVPITKSPAPKLVDPHFGLSWFMHTHNGETALTHAGAGAAFVAQMRIYPQQDLGIAIMANSTYLGKDMGTTIIDKLSTLKW